MRIYTVGITGTLGIKASLVVEAMAPEGATAGGPGSGSSVRSCRSQTTT